MKISIRVFAVILFLSGMAYAAQNAFLAIPPKYQPLTIGGVLPGGQLYTCVPGTTCGPGMASPKATYTDSTGATPNTNPVILDANGAADVWLEGSYKFQLYDALNNLVYTKDNVSSISIPTTYGVDASILGLAATVAAAGATPETIVVSNSQSLSTNLTIPANITLSVIYPGSISVGNGVSLTVNGASYWTGGVISGQGNVTFNGAFFAGAYQVFTGTGTITGLKKVFPEWWGATPYADYSAASSGSSDSTSAINKAIVCLRSSLGGELDLNGMYRVTAVNFSQTSYNNDAIIVHGIGQRVSGFYGTSATSIVVDLLGADWLTFENLSIFGTGTCGILLARQSSGTANYCNNHTFRNFTIEGTWSIAAAVVVGAEITRWYNPVFINTTSPYTSFIASDSNVTSITSPNGTILSGAGNGSTCTDNVMYGAEFDGYGGNNAIPVRFAGQVQWVMFGGEVTNTHTGATGCVFVQYESDLNSYNFTGPVEWFGTLFEGQGIVHYLKGVVGQSNVFNNIEANGGFYNLFNAAPWDVIDANINSTTACGLQASLFHGTKFNAATSSPSVHVSYVVASVIDLSTAFAGSSITIDTPSVLYYGSQLLASYVNGSSSTYMSTNPPSYGTAVPTTGIYPAQQRIMNINASSGQPNGWICTQAGGAVSTTRANSTTYANGVWATWTTGTTVWKVISGGGGQSASSPPSITGIAVGGTVVDGALTWQLMSLTTAGFITQGNAV